MQKLFVMTLAGLILAFGTFATQPASAEAVKSLRGGIAIPQSKAPAAVFDLVEQEKPFARAFRDQPPLVTHKVAKFWINLEKNRCLDCHDKSTYKQETAPMTGKSHYVGADGKEMEKINMGRYFCNQCHVPQANAKPLVENTFAPIKWSKK